MQDQVNQLQKRIEVLENMLKNKSTSFDDKIRNIVFFDQDTSSSTGSGTSVVTSVDFIGQTVTTASITTLPIAKFVRAYFRGQVYNIPVYTVV